MKRFQESLYIDNMNALFTMQDYLYTLWPGIAGRRPLSSHVQSLFVKFMPYTSR